MKKLSLMLSFVLLICCMTLFSACGKTPESYEVDVEVWFANYGIVYGDGTFEENTTCTISAVPKQDSTFMAWMHDNVVVSYDAEYSFEVTNETCGTYIAIFTCPDLYLVTPKQLVYSDNFVDQPTIKNVTLFCKLGNSYQILNEVYSGDSTLDEFNLDNITLALDRRTKIIAEVNLIFVVETIIEEETVEVERNAKTFIEIDLTELTTTDYVLNIPDGIEGEAVISFVFEEFSIPEEQPEDEGGEEVE